MVVNEMKPREILFIHTKGARKLRRNCESVRGAAKTWSLSGIMVENTVEVN